jgi:hypothetical protein
MVRDDRSLALWFFSDQQPEGDIEGCKPVVLQNWLRKERIPDHVDHKFRLVCRTLDLFDKVMVRVLPEITGSQGGSNFIKLFMARSRRRTKRHTESRFRRDSREQGLLVRFGLLRL